MDVTSLKIQIVEFNSALQKESIFLRDKVLRKPLGLHYTIEQLKEEEHQIHMVALFQQQVVGVVLLQPLNKLQLKMRQFAVDEQFQNQKIGTYLVDFLENYALSNGYKEIILHARKFAVDFYSKLKYQIIGDEFEEVGIPHYKMQKLIC